jgi:hypothetical protein
MAARGARPPRLPRPHHVVLLLAALLVRTVAADEAWRPVEQHWYEFLINGAKAGWMSQALEEAPGSKRLRTVIESQLSIDRGPQAMQVRSRTAFVETADGRAVEVTTEQQQSAHTVRTTWVFGDGRITQTVHQAGRETVRELPWPEGVWLTPMAAERFARQRREAGADEYTFRMLDPENGIEPITVRSRRHGTGTFRFDGRELPVEIWKTTTDVLPIEATEHFSSDGHLLYQRMPMLGGTMEVRIALREDALRPAAGGPELMVQTFVCPDRPLRDVERLRRARLRLRAINGTMPTLPSGGAQAVVPGPDDGTVVLAIDVDRRRPATAEEIADGTYLESSAMIGSDDPLVRKLAANVTRHLDDAPLERAEAMRKRVLRHITRKGLETAFASAAETAQLRQGDCSEHAVLLCAMLRADGIPARVASGLVYVDEFAGHVGTSSLADGSGNADLTAMVLLMGNLEIEVLEPTPGAGG